MWPYSSLINRWHLYLSLGPGWTFATFLPKEYGESDLISDHKGWHSFFLALRLRTLFLGPSCRRVKKPRLCGETTCKRSSWQSQLRFQTTGRISTRCVNETPLRCSSPSHHLTPITWESLRDDHLAELSQLLGPWKTIIENHFDHFAPLSLRWLAWQQ